MDESGSASMPRPEVQFAWESRSMSSTRWPRRARAWERFMAVVVFPTPPFWFATAMTFTNRKDGGKFRFSNDKLRFGRFRDLTGFAVVRNGHGSG